MVDIDRGAVHSYFCICILGDDQADITKSGINRDHRVPLEFPAEVQGEVSCTA